MSSLRPALLALLLGALLGVSAKALADVTVVGEVLLSLGIWVFTASLFAYYSRTAIMAAVGVFLFFTGVLGGYYLYTAYLWGFFPKVNLIGWALFVVAAAFGGWIVWQARGRQWAAALCAALPIAFLVLQGYTFIFNWHWARALDLAFALVLLILLPKDMEQRVRTLFFSAGVGLMLYGQNFMPTLFGGL